MRLNSKGFTLGELLIVLALITILAGLAVPTVTHIQRSLRQTELDSKAEIIYMAVQNRMMQLYASGNNDLLDSDQVFYLRKGTELADKIITKDVLEAELLGDEVHWVIELVPYNSGNDQGSMGASVNAVFYSEKGADVSGEPDFIFDSYRSKRERQASGAWIGYYGMAVQEETDGEY